MAWLITGGAGYIGSHVVECVLSIDKQAIVLDDLSTGFRSRLDPNVEFIQTSLHDTNGLENLFETHEITGVVHLAAKKRVEESINRPEYYWYQNVGGLQNLLSTMRRYEVKNFVFSSSASVYGQTDTYGGAPIHEDLVCRPINPYGITKLEGEFLSHKVATDDDFKVVALRYFNVAGADNSRLGDRNAFNLIPIVFDAISHGKRPVVYGNDYATVDGTCIRDYVHVQDLAEAHVSAINFVEGAEPGFSEINIGTGIGASVLDVLSEIQDVTQIEISPVFEGRRNGDPASLVADVSKAKSTLNWKSRLNLQQMVSSAWSSWVQGNQ